MSVTGTRTFPALSRARFDPRAVLIALAILLTGTASGWALAGVTGQQRDAVAVPVAALCVEGGVAGAQLDQRGACAAADSAGVGPFRSEVGATGATGAAGEDGANGAAGAAGRDGTDSTVPGPAGRDGAAGAVGVTGQAGAAGSDGETPACLSEPAQCRGANGADGTAGSSGKDGAPGRDGQDGAPGPPGPTCPDGTNLQPVTFASGESGLGCVTTTPDDPEATG